MQFDNHSVSDGCSPFVKTDCLDDTCIDDILMRLDIEERDKKLKKACLYARWNKEVFSAIQKQLNEHLRSDTSQFIPCSTCVDSDLNPLTAYERELKEERNTILRIDKLLGKLPEPQAKSRGRLEVTDWRLERLLGTPDGKVARFGQQLSIKTNFLTPTDAAGKLSCTNLSCFCMQFLVMFASCIEQRLTERVVLSEFTRSIERGSTGLNREGHIAFLKRGLTEPLHPSFISLEASRPWIIYWITHALDLLDALHGDDFSIPSFLARCQDPILGGFGGGPGQLPHLATTYASVSALVCIGTDEALGLVDRVKLKSFLLSVKDPATGAFRMHDNGEIDIRGTYCAVAVASLLGILDEALTAGVAEYIARCQTYEGGIAGEPGMEAHGGYGYCGLAALVLLPDRRHSVDLNKYAAWLARRQMSVEGGYQGRTNKLVDSCYTFWQGASFELLNRLRGTDSLTMTEPGMAAMYVLLACQADNGGLRDKPGKSPDFYHSCYALSGLATTASQLLRPNCVVYNNCVDKVTHAKLFWSTSQ